MINYKQKYEKDVICAVIDSNKAPFDNTLTDDGVLSAVGNNTSNDLTKVTNVSTFGIFDVKPDTILRFTQTSELKIYDDKRTFIYIYLKSFIDKQWTALTYNVDPNVKLGLDDTNITFDKFDPLAPMTIPISSLKDKTNVSSFTATVTVPNDVTCNYETGEHQLITGSAVAVLFNGNIKKGDTVTIKRNNRPDTTTTVNFDTNLAFANLGMNTSDTLEITYKHKITDEPPVHTRKYTLETNIQNAKVIEPKPDTDGKYYLDSEHTKITVVANDGYTFENDGSFTYNKSILNRVTATVPATHSNSMTITLPSNLDWSAQNVFKLTIGATKSDIITYNGGFTNIYKADYNNLLKFSNEVIVKITGGGSVQSYDVTPYINNLIMLPFNVPTGENASIVVGNETFKTQLPTVDNNYLTVDLGKITVPEQYKNGYDYFNVKTRLMLPYTNLIELDPMHVINKTVSIKYVVNVVNGDTTINVYSDNDLFLSQQVNLANEIPFISKATSGSQYAVINQLKTHFRNEISQAYIIIEQPTPILNADYYATNEKGTLKNYTGNVKAKLLNNININNNDLIGLQNLLETGVKIK